MEQSASATAAAAGAPASSAVAGTSSASSAAAPKWDAAAVSEYLARWQVEEAVQQAVNSAIRLRAVDPVLHVAGFLEARGRVMDEQQQQAAAAAVGSSNVMESRRES